MRGVTVVLAIATCLAAAVSSTDGFCISPTALNYFLHNKNFNMKEDVCKKVHDELAKMVEEASFPGEVVDNIEISRIELQRLVASADQCDVSVNGRTILITLHQVKFDITGLWKKLAAKNAGNKEFEVDVKGATIVIMLKTGKCTINDIRVLDCDLVLESKNMAIINGPKMQTFDDHLIDTAKEQVHEACASAKALQEVQDAAGNFIGR